jgi:hypothetical protein
MDTMSVNRQAGGGVDLHGLNLHSELAKFLVSLFYEMFQVFFEGSGFTFSNRKRPEQSHRRKGDHTHQDEEVRWLADSASV